MSDYPIEQYDPEIKKVRRLGDVLLKSYSKIESYIDEIIMSWIGGYGSKLAMVTKLKYLRKYSPLLSKMFFIGKVNALVKYQIVKSNDEIYKLLLWLNEERNLFAHYNVYRYQLEAKYQSEKQRIKMLKNLKDILISVERYQKAVSLSSDKLNSAKD